MCRLLLNINLVIKMKNCKLTIVMEGSRPNHLYKYDSFGGYER